MATLCNVTGTFVDPEGEAIANTIFAFTRDGTVEGDTGTSIFPEYFTVMSNGSGAVDFDAYPGTYTVRVKNARRKLEFTLTVPNAATADLDDTLPVSGAVIPAKAVYASLADFKAAVTGGYAPGDGVITFAAGIPYVSDSSAVSNDPVGHRAYSELPETLTNKSLDLVDGNTLIGTPRVSFSTAGRAALVSWYSNGKLRDGTLISDGKVWYTAQEDASEIADIEGLICAGAPELKGRVSPNHFGVNTTPGTTDMTTAFSRALAVGENVNLFPEIYEVDPDTLTMASTGQKIIGSATVTAGQLRVSVIRTSSDGSYVVRATASSCGMQHVRIDGVSRSAPDYLLRIEPDGTDAADRDFELLDCGLTSAEKAIYFQGRGLTVQFCQFAQFTDIIELDFPASVSAPIGWYNTTVGGPRVYRIENCRFHNWTGWGVTNTGDRAASLFGIHMAVIYGDDFGGIFKGVARYSNFEAITHFRGGRGGYEFTDGSTGFIVNGTTDFGETSLSAVDGFTPNWMSVIFKLTGRVSNFTICNVVGGFNNTYCVLFDNDPLANDGAGQDAVITNGKLLNHSYIEHCLGNDTRTDDMIRVGNDSTIDGLTIKDVSGTKTSQTNDGSAKLYGKGTGTTISRVYGSLNRPPASYSQDLTDIKMTFEGDTGIGTLLPQRRLHVSDTGSIIARLERTGSTAGVGLEFENDAGNIDFFATPTGANTGKFVPGGDNSIDLGDSSARLKDIYGVRHMFTSAVGISYGSGSPEGAVSASRGSLYVRTDGGTGTTLYVKESGTGNTGWAAK
jgi:hypothetical protein